MPITPERLAEAIKALGLTIPIRSSYELEDGTIVLVTRSGKHPYKPKKKTKRPAGQRKPSAP
jgi:hypothetical protein